MNIKSIGSLLKTQLPDLQGVYLFGSYAAGLQTEKSDIDIAILCPRHLTPKVKVNLKERLGNMLNKNIDLIELRFVDIIFQEEIIRTAKRITTIDEMACETYEDFIYCNAMDFREFRKPHVLEIIARGSIYG